ncbi:MAG: ribonuclease HII [Methylococcales bacterium]
MASVFLDANAENSCIAGVDEAGRGPWFGPVVAAAVILNPLKPIAGLADSKKLSEKQRDSLFDKIQNQSLCWAIAQASVEEIDRLNILQATLLAMQRAVHSLTIQAQLVLIDGNQIPALSLPAQAIIKGDSKVAAISAASILAKVARDRQMLEYHQQYPDFSFHKHKGYGTKQHLLELQRFGVLPEHRKSFAPIRKMLMTSPESR